MRLAFVLDCSVAAAWCFQEEKTPALLTLQDRLILESALVPQHWYLEVTNAIVTGERRKRIVPDDATKFIQLLDMLPIEADDELVSRAFEYILPLARAHALTTYDAAYLDLALRRQLPLASLDDDLRRAAASLGVQLLGK
jgi:predicted nucleic acid-binding protein